jgi:hypothetical protein
LRSTRPNQARNNDHEQADRNRRRCRYRPVWTESTWPFPVDQFGGGWAFQCKAANCGTNVNLYLRPKLGFCNCQTGVADDEELDRVGDVDLVGSGGSALGPGRTIAVRSMKGRSRAYEVNAPSAKSVLSIAFNSRCDVTVATVVADGDPVAQEQAVLEFLNGDLVMHRIMSLFAFYVPVAAVLTVVTLALAVEARRFRSRAPAEQKSIALLRSWLTPEQLDRWNTREEFEVIGGDTGTRYRITYGTVMNVHQLDHNGKPFAQWCFRPEGKLAVGDVLLAQMIALENMERRALALANSQRFLRLD